MPFLGAIMFHLCYETPSAPNVLLETRAQDLVWAMHAGVETCKTLQALSLVFYNGNELLLDGKPLAQGHGYPTRRPRRFIEPGLVCTAAVDLSGWGLCQAKIQSVNFH